MTRIALIGAGFIGGVHAAALDAHPDVDFALVYDIDGGRAFDLASHHGTYSTDDLTKVFDRSRIDAVLIASSSNTHTDHLRRAADAGIAALCEKPIDPDVAAAVETVRYVERSGIPAMVGFNRRFDADYAALQQALAAGDIGTTELVQMSSRGPQSPPIDYVKVSGGQMRDQAVHFFDLTRWLTNEDPLLVHATGSALADPRILEYGDVDTSVTALTLPSGAIAQIDCIRRTGYGYDERMEVFGSEGLLQVQPHRTHNLIRYAHGEVITSGLHAGWFERVRPTYAASLAAFVDALTSGSPMPVTLRDGLKAQAISEAATVSLRTGRAEPIDYPD